MILGATAYAFELLAERLELVPPRLLIPNRAGAIRGVLKVASEILNIAFDKAGDEAIIHARHIGGSQLKVAKEAADRRGQLGTLVGIGLFELSDADIDAEPAGDAQQPFLFRLTHLIGGGFALGPAIGDHLIGDLVVGEAGPKRRIKSDDAGELPVLRCELILQMIEETFVVVGPFADRLAESGRYIAAMDVKLALLEPLIQSPDAVNGKISEDDIHLFAALRALSIVRRITYPPIVESYRNRMAVLTGVQLHDACAI